MRNPIHPALVLAFALVCFGCTSTKTAMDATTVVAPPPRAVPPGTFTKAELLEDYDHLSNILLTRNPLAFTDKAELSNFIAKGRNLLRDGMGELDFYRVLTPIIVHTRCGHTGIFLSSTTDAKLKAEQGYLPILVRIVDGRIFVLSPLSATGIKPGSEILAINGRSASDILSVLYDNITTDGENISRMNRPGFTGAPFI